MPAMIRELCRLAALWLCLLSTVEPPLCSAAPYQGDVLPPDSVPRQTETAQGDPNLPRTWDSGLPSERTARGRTGGAAGAGKGKPRCGVLDPVVRSDAGGGPGSLGERRQRRYSVDWTRWDKKHLTYRILNYPYYYRMTEDQVDDAIGRAFKQWSDNTPLTFRKLRYGHADIHIKFATWDHDCPYEFDGINGTIAHAFVPNGLHGDLDGDVHFDDAEVFTYAGDEGYNLYQVAVHELGHSLGLQHSWTEGAVMAPEYPGYVPSLQLQQDDIRAAQLLYGLLEPKDYGDPAAPCNRGYDAATMIGNLLYVFKDRRFWRLSKPGKMVAPSAGLPIRKRFLKLPRMIDAAYQRPQDGHVVFFKGPLYWVYNGRRPLPGYPRQISELGLPDNLDAAVTLRRYNTTYFFKDHRVWQYNEMYQAIEYGYPYHILDVWDGIPPFLDAAFDYTDGYTYFIQGKTYFRYNNEYRNADPGFPRYFGNDFMGC